MYFVDIEQKLSEKDKVIEELSNKVRNMGRGIDKLDGNIEEINTVEEGKKEIIELLKLYAGF
jgi:peptidoglycan hydrolase CwlO-like protein